MISDARYKDHNHYNIIYKKIWQKIDQRFKYILYQFDYYSLYDEIYNLSDHKINLICNLIKIILYNHINLFGEKIKMINIHYLLLKIFQLLGIDLGISLDLPRNLSNRYEKYFKNIIEYSYDDIIDIIDEFFEL